MSGPHPLFTVFLLSLLSICLSDSTSPAIFATICSSNQSSNATGFDVSFVDTMESIYQNVSQTGFGYAVSGSNTNSSPLVYGLGQCFSYLSMTDCQLCYAQSRVKLPHCLPSIDARIYLDGCFLRYSDFDFFSDGVDGSDNFTCGNSSYAGSVSVFGNTTERLMGNLTEVASSLRNGYFQVGSSDVVADTKVYGMAQCWKTLNESECRDCLSNARKNVLSCVPAKDGMVMNAGCFVRYSIDPFYLSSSSPSNGSSARRRAIVILACIVAVLAVIGIFILWSKFKSKPDPFHEIDASSTEIIRAIATSNLSFKYDDLRKATDDFSQINRLGEGGYGAVYKVTLGVLPDWREIAVKRLFFNTRQWLEQFFNEVRLVSQVQHKNLVKLLGCSVEGPESLLVYEYLCNTSLDHFLFDAFKKNSLDWERRFEIIVGTAEGLSYLHNESEIRIIHRDIKASNILLDERFKPKIADFGLARYFMDDQSHLSTGLAGTFGYMAPEYIVHGQLTEKADIYSYGVLLLEIITGRKNHNSVATSADGHSLMSLIWEHFNSKTLIEMLDPALKVQCNEDEAVKLFQIGLLCTQASPSLRPPMWKVVELLNKDSRQLPLPAQPPFLDIKGSGPQSSSSESSSLLSTSEKSPFSLNQLSVTGTFQAR
ncbi:cysteine-rich RECEPTOR-like kinase [Rhynchospora pubera]|uniref:Cysteine-rich RECEPTOR-like kinase n=1 Tax=Rhynchospora pubera TaxID=906938 RepID=A0AAV8GCZ8_9POAL|nr:cysteine-rich RECEPTOR-like kinase [Rhynchospora pubera]